MLNIVKPNYATIGLGVAVIVSYEYVNRLVVMPGVIIGVIALLLFNTVVWNFIKHKCTRKGVLTT